MRSHLGINGDVLRKRGGARTSSSACTFLKALAGAESNVAVGLARSWGLMWGWMSKVKGRFMAHLFEELQRRSRYKCSIDSFK
ncbi:hypothetical protein ACEQPO_26730 [Bacillus sp. SL00103]